MDFTAVKAISQAVLYEGYMLYPYRASSLKNSRSAMFGSLYPKAYCLATGETEPWSMQAECLVREDGQTMLHAVVRFLQAAASDGQTVEREAVLAGSRLAQMSSGARRFTFSFPESLQVVAEVSADRVRDGVLKVNVRIANETPPPPGEVEPNMLSTQILLGVEWGRFLSLIDPAPDVRDLAEACRNRGIWPVLVGDRARADMMLAAPIILYDFPQIAQESPGNLYDGTEIDELLTLRILTLTESEKQVMKRAEPTRQLLERTEKLTGDSLLALHGAMRPRRSPCWGYDSAAQATTPRPGDLVRLHPRGRADIFDLALEGQTATVASIEQDFESGIYCAVTLDADPGRDLGIQGKPGHRFYFRPDELELLGGDS